MNHSFDYQDICGKEPDTNDYKDLQRWDKWNAWFRRFSKYFPASNGVMGPDGHVMYHPLLKSQRTRLFRERLYHARHHHVRINRLPKAQRVLPQPRIRHNATPNQPKLG